MYTDALEIADIELSQRFPAYAALSPIDRQSVLYYAAYDLAPRQGLGAGGTITVAVIGIITALITAGVTVASLVVESRRSKEAQKAAQAAAAVQQQTAQIQAETATLQAGVTKQETMYKSVLAGVLGLAGIAAIFMFIK